MKKILFSLVALVCCMSMNAQVMKVMKNGEEVAKYNGADYSVVFDYEVSEKWTSLGQGTMTDDIIIPLFGVPAVTYNVMFEESTTRPGVFRVVDPYGPGYPYYNDLIELGFSMPDEGNYLEINCADPDAVYIERQSLAMDLGDGLIELISTGATFLDQGDSMDAIKNAGYFGKYDKTTGMITFPTQTSSSGNNFQGYLYEDGELAYYAGVNSKIEFQLPTEANTRQQVKASKPATATNLHKAQKAQLSTEALSSAKVAAPTNIKAPRGLVAKDLDLRK